jgi:hydroxymethylbilane synthase
VPLSTTGDRDHERPIPDFGGRGAFTAEIDAALAAGAVDLAVHSLKDLPTASAPGLALGAVPPREDPRDALISAGGAGLDDLPRGARVGTSSLRRAAQLRDARADLVVLPLRGNVETRLRKLEAGSCEAVVLALAGLLRLGLAQRATEVLAPSRMLPAPGQGALGVQRREGDDVAARLLEPLHDRDAGAATAAERAFLAALQAGCSAPVGALAEVREGGLEMQAFAAMEDGSAVVRTAGRGDPDAPDELGRRLAGEVLSRLGSGGLAALRAAAPA